MNSSGIEEHGIHRIRKRGPKKDSSTASNQNKKHCPQNYKHACNKHSNDEAAKIVKANNHSDEMQCDKQVAAVEEETWKLGEGIGPRSELDEFDKANQSADDEGMLEEMTLEGKMVVVENLSLHVEEDMLLREFSQYVFIEFLGLHCFLPHEMEAYSKKDPKTSQSDDAQNRQDIIDLLGSCTCGSRNEISADNFTVQESPLKCSRQKGLPDA